MAFFRIVNCKEIKKALMLGCWPPSDRDNYPYNAGEVVFMFDYENAYDMINRYGSMSAQLRDEIDKIFVLYFDFNGNDVEIDKSQSGMPESRVCRGFVDLDKIKCIGYCDVICSNPGNFDVSELNFFDKHKTIKEVCE